jgi:hypothetical protein
MTDARLRELYARTTASVGKRDTETHADPEALLALVRREGPEEERLALLDHVMACDSCRGEFELLRAVERAGGSSSESSSGTIPFPVRGGAAAADDARHRPLSRWRGFIPIAAAASLLLAVGIGIGVQRGGGGEPADVMRGAADEVALVAPAAEFRVGGPITFAWRPVPGARRYELEVVDGGGTAVFSTRTTDTLVVLNDATRLVPGVDYQWWVRAVTDGGAQPRSPMRRLRLRAE